MEKSKFNDIDELSIFKENVDLRIAKWIKSMPSDELDLTLMRLELITDGSMYERANRLYKRLQGDYTASEFVQSQDADEESTRDKRNQLCVALMRSDTLPADIRDDFFTILATNMEATERDSADSIEDLSTSSPTRTKEDNPSEPRTIQPPSITTSSQDIYTQSTLPTANYTQTFPQVMPTCQLTRTSEATHNAAGERLRWCRLPDGRAQHIPEPTAIELKRAILSEQELLKLNEELHLKIIKLTSENKELQQKNAEINRINNDLRKQMQDIVADAQRQTLETQIKFNARSNARVQFQERHDLIDNEFDLSQRITREELNPNAPLFHSTTRPTFAPHAYTATSTSAASEPVPPACSSWGRGVVASSQPQSSRISTSPSWGRGDIRDAYRNSLSQAMSTQQNPVQNATTPSHGWSNLQATRGLFDASRPSFSNKPLGKTVREWKIQFSGESSTSVEEFLEQIEENCRLDRIGEDELLDSLAFLFKKPALLWYRMVSPTWRTYADFKEAALEAYSRSRKFKRNLSVEAYLRTQGADEPVRDYLSALHMIFSRFDTPWAIQDQIALAIDNMLPRLKRKLKKSQEHFATLQQLLARAQEIETLESDEHWKPPPSIEQSLLPEAAYKPKAKVARPKTSLASASEKIASISEADLEKAFQNLFDKKLRDLVTAKSKGLPESRSAKSGRTSPPGSSKPNEASSLSRRSSRDDDSGRGRGRGRAYGKGARVITPKSDKNKGRKVGPDAKLICWECSWPGYTKLTCPECSQPKDEKNVQGKA